MGNQNTRIATSFIIGLIVGVGGYWLFAHHAPAAENDNSLVSTTDQVVTSTSTPASLAIITGDNGVVVNDQVPGYSVAVSEVVFKNPSWVAIADDINGQPGRILGAKYFGAGKSSGLISLLRPTIAGHKYIAELRGNVGNYHVFNSVLDKPLTDANGIIMATFAVSATPSGTVNSSSGASASSAAASSPSTSEAASSSSSVEIPLNL